MIVRPHIRQAIAAAALLAPGGCGRFKPVHVEDGCYAIEGGQPILLVRDRLATVLTPRAPAGFGERMVPGGHIRLTSGIDLNGAYVEAAPGFMLAGDEVVANGQPATRMRVGAGTTRPVILVPLEPYGVVPVRHAPCRPT